MLPNLLSEAVVSEDVASRILSQFYDGDPLSLFKLLMDRSASDSVRFWQWRTLIRVAINNEIDHDTFRSLLTRTFDDLEQERDLMAWSGWESVNLFRPDGPRAARRARPRRRAHVRTNDGRLQQRLAYARAHPECPFEGDPIEFYRGLTAELNSAIESRRPTRLTNDDDQTCYEQPRARPPSQTHG
jgi:hypothetical protein